MRRTRSALLAAALAAAVGLPALPAAAEEAAPTTMESVNSARAMNVFRRYPAEQAEAMFDFYENVIGLPRLGSFSDVGAGGVHRFDAGDSELKLTAQVDGRAYAGGGVADATGLRYVTFFFPDAAAVAERFAAEGLAAPGFEPAGENVSAALVQDPSGLWVKLVAAPGRDAAYYAQLSVGLAVSDLEASRAFYRDFAGLAEQRAIEDGLLGATVHPFRHGSTTVALFEVGDGRPADTGSGGIQYVVSDAALADRLAKERGYHIDQPLSGLPGYQLRTIWIDDPDGITNYFAQVGAPAEGRGE